VPVNIPASTMRPIGPVRLETIALGLLLLFVAAVQLSVAAAGILLALLLSSWIGLLWLEHERPDVPRFFWPLAAYTGVTLVSVSFSLNPLQSLWNAKEVLLYLIVPLVYGLAHGRRAWTLADVILNVGAVIAALGIVQYGVLGYDHLGQRPHGSMGHYMTYSGLLMLVAGLAMARVLFNHRGRVWPAMVMPALVVALALTFTRSAWVGACASIGLLLVLKDFRLLAAAPVVAALFFALAPIPVVDRMTTVFDLQDPTNRDRIAMISAGLHMVADHPLTGVGPDVVKDVYPQYRDPGAVEAVVPHLHNNPLHIAAERGVAGLAIWVWFLVAAVGGLVARLREPETRPLAAAGLAALVGMLTAGMFEYNFGDSEFLMLLLVLITLPDAAARSAPSRSAQAFDLPRVRSA
jgi:O-antigen ligase